MTEKVCIFGARILKMEKEKFLDHLNRSSEFLIDFTKEKVVNSLSKNLKYVIKVNEYSDSPHLTNYERGILSKLKSYRNIILTKDDVVGLLWNDNKVPLWINSSVIKTSPEETIIELTISRRLRSEEDLNYKADIYAPFHPLIPLPPNLENDQKFDINWKTFKPRKNTQLNRIISRIIK